MDWSFDEFVNACVVRDQPDSFAVWFGQKECRVAPYGGFVYSRNDPFVDEVLEHFLRLLLKR